MRRRPLGDGSAPPGAARRRSARRHGAARRRSAWQSGVGISFLSDFGTADPYVGIVHAVIAGIAPATRVIDITHHVPPQAIAVGALLLRSAVDYFPAGTVHLAVVDPGVGSARSPIIAVTERALLVGPDNGLLEPSARALGLREVRRIEDESVFLRPLSRTFHARDVFGPVAAHLAAGRSPQSFGPRLATMAAAADAVAHDDGTAIEGRIVHIDHFGNLISNINAADVRMDAVVSIGDHRLDRLSTSYADVPGGQILAVVGSWGTVEIACNGGSAAVALGARVGDVIVARRKGRSA